MARSVAEVRVGASATASEAERRESEGEREGRERGGAMVRPVNPDPFGSHGYATPRDPTLA